MYQPGGIDQIECDYWKQPELRCQQIAHSYVGGFMVGMDMVCQNARQETDMGFFRDFFAALNRTPEEIHAEIEEMHPGYLVKLEAARKRDAALAAAREASRTAAGKTGSGMSATAEAAHEMALRGAIDPKVAFSMGVPGAPDGTGKLVGPGGHYKG